MKRGGSQKILLFIPDKQYFLFGFLLAALALRAVNRAIYACSATAAGTRAAPTAFPVLYCAVKRRQSYSIKAVVCSRPRAFAPGVAPHN